MVDHGMVMKVSGRVWYAAVGMVIGRLASWVMIVGNGWLLGTEGQ